MVDQCETDSKQNNMRHLKIRFIKMMNRVTLHLKLYLILDFFTAFVKVLF